MTEAEWLSIGYEKNIIEIINQEEIKFHDAYRAWFKMKMTCVKPGSLDRIEVTYNRYYDGHPISEKCISKITEKDIIDFLTPIILSDARITLKELQRILQIIRSTLIYFRDINKGGVCLYDWEKIKRYIPMDKLNTSRKQESAVPAIQVEKLIEHVVKHKIYAQKQCGCLALCMNFYLGLRIGELASLTFNDFDFEKGVIKIYKTESKYYERLEDGSKIGCMVYRVVDSCKTVYSVREIPILPEVKQFYELIKEWHEVHKIESPFLASDGDDVILVQSLATTLRKLCELCDIPYFHSHMIRKTFATKLHFSGVPTRVVSDLMGHAEIGTTENSYILSYGKNYQKVMEYMKNALDYKL
ncbi:MAG: site-specific integrase [Butyrivibrio sp.]|nr:site-specific integrase [Acetatifactor muris]MCM1558769.1 site-specific integrase [Butyrivibrio sp.]